MNNYEEPIIITQTFSNSLEEVWNAISKHEEMVIWYFPMLEKFEAVVGFETAFTVSVEDRVYPHQWKVTEVIPMKKLAYDWTFEGFEGRSDSIFQLSEKDGQVELTLTNNVLEKFPEGIPEFQRESAVGGWTYLLKDSLVKYLQDK